MPLKQLQHEKIVISVRKQICCALFPRNTGITGKFHMADNPGLRRYFTEF